MTDRFGQKTVEITREQLNCWAGRDLTDDEVDRLDDAIPHSSIPDAISVIADSIQLDDPPEPPDMSGPGNPTGEGR